MRWSAVIWVYPRSKKWDVGISINGLLAGLVAITCPCYWVSPTGAIAIGAIAGVIMILAVDFTEWIRVDDPCGAFAVHGACGIWGTLSLGLFAVGNYGGRGVRRQGRALRRQHQPARRPDQGQRDRSRPRPLAAGLLLMFGLKAIGMLRISRGRGARGSRHPRARCAGVPPRVAYMGYSPLPPGRSSSSAAPGVPAECGDSS